MGDTCRLWPGPPESWLAMGFPREDGLKPGRKLPLGADLGHEATTSYLFDAVLRP
jgi:hypothetical protein